MTTATTIMLMIMSETAFRDEKQRWQIKNDDDSGNGGCFYDGDSATSTPSTSTALMHSHSVPVSLSSGDLKVMNGFSYFPHEANKTRILNDTNNFIITILHFKYMKSHSFWRMNTQKM